MFSRPLGVQLRHPKGKCDLTVLILFLNGTVGTLLVYMLVAWGSADTITLGSSHLCTFINKALKHQQGQIKR